MGFHDWFRLSAHAVITDSRGRVLLLRAGYGDMDWGLPGGALDPGETIHDALLRECEEELGSTVRVEYLSGVYAHPAVQSHAFVFRCTLPEGARIQLSDEHTDARYFDPQELTEVQKRRVLECINFEDRSVQLSSEQGGIAMRRNVLLLAATAGVLAVIGGLAGFAALTRATTVALMICLFLLPWTEPEE